MAAITRAYSEEVKGWRTKYSFIPDWMCSLDNRFYTIKNGQLWEHHDQDNAVHNNFYGTQYSSIITTVFNEAEADDKIFKTLVLEADQKWDAEIITNYTESTITAEEFNTRESRQFSFMRKNENTDDLRGHTAQGIGVIVSSATTTIQFGRLPGLIDIGNQLYQINGTAHELIGTITVVNMTANTITVNAITTAPVNGYYCYAKKNARVEGGEVRGRYAEVTLTNDNTDQGELYAITSNAVKSFV